MTFGAGRDRMGLTLIVTIGTGLGTAMFINGHLVPNMELGHIEIQGMDAELFASDAARKREDLPLKKWAKRFNRYLSELASKEFEQFRQYLELDAEIVPAQLLNDAGVVGAALAAGSASLVRPGDRILSKGGYPKKD